MEKFDINEEQSQQAVTLLEEIINWWDTWTNSENPSEMEDPPIESARKLLSKLYN